MAARSRIRPAHWIVLVLVAAPAWKVVGSALAARAPGRQPRGAGRRP